MGRIKDIATDMEISNEELNKIDEQSPIQYIVVDDEPLDIDEINLLLQMAADEAREKE